MNNIESIFHRYDGTENTLPPEKCKFYIIEGNKYSGYHISECYGMNFPDANRKGSDKRFCTRDIVTQSESWIDPGIIWFTESDIILKALNIINI